MNRPPTQFAWNGDAALAYQVVGDGPIDLLYLQGYASNLDLNWDSPHLARFLHGLARESRLIVTDRRGWGLSERFTPGDVADIDAMTDDLVAVLDAARSERAAILATFECSIVAALFAAAYPARTIGLALVDPFVTYSRRPETPWMPSPEQWAKAIEDVRATWGTAAWTQGWTDAREADWFTRLTRAAIAPGAMAAELQRYRDTDITAVLPNIHVPTLVMTNLDADAEDSPQSGRLIAQRITGARLVEHSSAGGLHRLHWYARADAVLDEVERFLRRIRDDELELDRVLATVVFVDMVASTELIGRVGDREWAAIQGRYLSAARTLLARFRGREVDTAGDGMFATFDGPARAVRCALALVDAVRPLGVEIRAGLHTGEVQTTGPKVTGSAVNLGARIAAAAERSEVLVSQTVRDLVAGSGLSFAERGEHQLKGIDEPVRLFAAQLSRE